MKFVKGKSVITALTVLLTACGSDENSSVSSQQTLFDNNEWFSFSYDNKMTKPLIYKDKVIKNNNQVLEYTATAVVGELLTALPSSSLLNPTGINNTIYNPYEGLDNLNDTFILTEKRLLNSPEKLIANQARPKKIIVNIGLSTLSTVPYNVDLYKDTSITTIEYVTRDLSGSLVTEAINDNIIVPYDTKILKTLNSQKSAIESSLVKLKAQSEMLQNSGSTGQALDLVIVQDGIKSMEMELEKLQTMMVSNVNQFKDNKAHFPKGAVAIQQTVATTYEDSVIFTPSNVIAASTISDWKASYPTDSMFRDYQWSGYNFACVVNLENIPTGDCAVNYKNKIYRANYVVKGVSKTPTYLFFNKIAADTIEAEIKKVLLQP